VQTVESLILEQVTDPVAHGTVPSLLAVPGAHVEAFK
jgi:hypothetical protein